MNISMKDLARMAGVSTTTVLRALKGRPDIKEETKDRILELVRRFNYRPNILARSLVTKRTYTIGIIVPDLMNPFFPALIKGIESTLWENEYNVIFANTNYDRDKETQAVNTFISRQVDGIIIAPIGTREPLPWISVLNENIRPIVFLSKVNNQKIDLVMADDAEGAYEAVRHLTSLGYRKVLYAGNLAGPWANSERIRGYKRALKSSKIAIDKSLIVSAPFGYLKNGYKLMKKFMASGRRIDAVLAFNDLMAIGIMKALNEQGLKVPEDIALVGFDNIEITSLPEISLTTVDIPKYKLGKVSAKLLIQRIGEREELGKNKDKETYTMEKKQIILKPSLVIRKSCGAVLKKDTPSEDIPLATEIGRVL